MKRIFLVAVKRMLLAFIPGVLGIGMLITGYEKLMKTDDFFWNGVSGFLFGVLLVFGAIMILRGMSFENFMKNF